jgi:hypothetical protein
MEFEAEGSITVVGCGFALGGGGIGGSHWGRLRKIGGESWIEIFKLRRSQFDDVLSRQTGLGS